MTESKLPLPLKTNGEPRTVEIQRAMKKKEEQLVQDTIILQKVNQVHREAFKSRFPGQCEHIMRLIAERLQAVMTRKPTDLSDPETWNATANEIQQLTQALKNIYDIHERFN